MTAYTSSFRLGQYVRVDSIDHNGLCGRDPHPNESHVGCIGMVIASSIDEFTCTTDPFEMANELAKNDGLEGFTLLHTVLLETPGGDQVLVFAEWELTAV